MISLKNQSVIVTGSSRGIGASIAQHLSSLEMRVAITYSSAHSKEKAEQAFQNLKGSGHLLVQLDVTDSESIKKAFNECLSQFGQLDALINNAGITKDALLLRMQDSDFDHVLKTNLYGSFYCAREAAKYMIKKRQGHIINISSVVAKVGNPGQANYVSSKAAIEGLTKSMARELASRNIKVNAIAPGYIQTEMVEKLNDNQKQAIINNILLKKIGTPKDVAETVAFLLSSEYITGQIISVNGGLAL